MLSHEVQHLIQDYEGFDNGTSSREAYEEFLAIYERARADVKTANLVAASRNRNIIQGEALKEFSPDQQHAYTVTCLATARPPSL